MKVFEDKGTPSPGAPEPTSKDEPIYLNGERMFEPQGKPRVIDAKAPYTTAIFS
jgi:hypothetical protein